MPPVSTDAPIRARRLPWLPARGRISRFELLLFTACAVLIAIGLPQNLQDIVVLTYLWGAVALAWNIAGGYAGLISFGHAAFFGIGAYASTILFLRLGITPWLGSLCGGLLAGVFGALLALICARLRGPFFILSTLAAAEVIRIGALNWTELTGGAEGLSILPVPDPANMVFESKIAYAALMLGFLLIVFAISKAVEASRYGFYLFAVRDDADAASAAGVDPLLARTAAMALSACLTGIGGALFAQYFLYLDPTVIVSPELSFQIALLPAVGGLGTAIGPVLGSVLITPLSELLRSVVGNAVAGLHLVIYSAVLIVVMLYFPGGLAAALGGAAPRRRRRSP